MNTVPQCENTLLSAEVLGKVQKYYRQNLLKVFKVLLRENSTCPVGLTALYTIIIVLLTLMHAGTYVLQTVQTFLVTVN